MKNERGFTLLEILLAMIILAVGGVSIISLFAAAVSLQYDSAMNQRRALSSPT
ncbi:MAG: prepilin-type N-terminal cleavage/methylation domain-containing protein [Planctomycetes bacterium]|nr:prepilin-type N-terminal cleavage/methylation domain-containing protein [Planctomycetota bacterium]